MGKNKDKLTWRCVYSGDKILVGEDIPKVYKVSVDGVDKEIRAGLNDVWEYSTTDEEAKDSNDWKKWYAFCDKQEKIAFDNLPIKEVSITPTTNNPRLEVSPTYEAAAVQKTSIYDDARDLTEWNEWIEYCDEIGKEEKKYVCVGGNCEIIGKPNFINGDIVKTPDGPGKVYKVDDDGIICVELDSDPEVLRDFDAAEVSKI